MTHTLKLPPIQLVLLTSLLLAGASACEGETKAPMNPSAPEAINRGVHTSGGLCSKDGTSVCGQQSSDGCWCDDDCHTFGDCCDDQIFHCDAPTVLGCQDTTKWDLSFLDSTQYGGATALQNVWGPAIGQYGEARFFFVPRLEPNALYTMTVEANGTTTEPELFFQHDAKTEAISYLGTAGIDAVGAIHVWLGDYYLYKAPGQEVQAEAQEFLIEGSAFGYGGAHFAYSDEGIVHYQQRREDGTWLAQPETIETVPDGSNIFSGPVIALGANGELAALYQVYSSEAGITYHLATRGDEGWTVVSEDLMSAMGFSPPEDVRTRLPRRFGALSIRGDEIIAVVAAQLRKLDSEGVSRTTQVIHGILDAQGTWTAEALIDETNGPSLWNLKGTSLGWGPDGEIDFVFSSMMATRGRVTRLFSRSANGVWTEAETQSITEQATPEGAFTSQRFVRDSFGRIHIGRHRDDALGELVHAVCSAEDGSIAGAPKVAFIGTECTCVDTDEYGEDFQFRCAPCTEGSLCMAADDTGPEGSCNQVCSDETPCPDGFDCQATMNAAPANGFVYPSQCVPSTQAALAGSSSRLRSSVDAYATGSACANFGAWDLEWLDIDAEIDDIKAASYVFGPYLGPNGERGLLYRTPIDKNRLFYKQQSQNGQWSSDEIALEFDPISNLKDESILHVLAANVDSQGMLRVVVSTNGSALSTALLTRSTAGAWNTTAIPGLSGTRLIDNDGDLHAVVRQSNSIVHRVYLADNSSPEDQTIAVGSSAEIVALPNGDLVAAVANNGGVTWKRRVGTTWSDMDEPFLEGSQYQLAHLTSDDEGLLHGVIDGGTGDDEEGFPSIAYLHQTATGPAPLVRIAGVSMPSITDLLAGSGDVYIASYDGWLIERTPDGEWSFVETPGNVSRFALDEAGLIHMAQLRSGNPVLASCAIGQGSTVGVQGPQAGFGSACACDSSYNINSKGCAPCPDTNGGSGLVVDGTSVNWFCFKNEEDDGGRHCNILCQGEAQCPSGFVCGLIGGSSACVAE